MTRYGVAINQLKPPSCGSDISLKEAKRRVADERFFELLVSVRLWLCLAFALAASPPSVLVCAFCQGDRRAWLLTTCLDLLTLSLRLCLHRLPAPASAYKHRMLISSLRLRLAYTGCRRGPLLISSRCL